MSTYQRLAAIRPASTSEAELYAPGTDEQAVVTITICNQDSAQRSYSIAHTDASGAATGEDWLVYEAPIGANETQQIAGICIMNPETLRVVASVADKISFVVYGSKG